MMSEENCKLRDAAYAGDKAAVESALNQGADVNAKDDDGKTALFRASNQGYTEIMKVLIDNGADVNVKTKEGATPLITACCFGRDLEAVELLISNGADVKAMSHERGYGLNPLLDSSEKGNYDTVKLLLDRGADVNIRTKDNKGALDVASNPSILPKPPEHLQEKTMKLLLERGC